MLAGYTGDGLRAWKQNAGGRTYFLYDGTKPVCELSANGGVSAVNTWGHFGLLSRHTGAGSVFYAFDPHGSAVQRLDSGGNVLSTQRFDAFGSRVSTDNNADPFAGYAGALGYYTDWETGLQLCTYRYYDPNLGRFLNRDPSGYNGGINLYEYANNSPTTHDDPLGLSVSTHEYGDVGCLGVLLGWLIGFHWRSEADPCAMLAGCIGSFISWAVEVWLDASPCKLFMLIPAIKGCIEGFVGSAVGCILEHLCKCGGRGWDLCLFLRCAVQAIIGCAAGFLIDTFAPEEAGEAEHKIADFVEEAFEGMGLLDSGECPFGSLFGVKKG